MGEAKRRHEARLDAYAEGRPWHVVAACPSCQCEDITIISKQAIPESIAEHFSSDIAFCRKCGALWEPLPAVHVEDPVGAEPCDNCAFRPGSPEQDDPVKWRALLDSLKPDPHGGFGGRFYCHKNVPIDMTKGPGNFLFPTRPVMMDGEPLRQRDGTVVTTMDTSKMRVCSGFLRMVWARKRKQEGKAK